MFGKLFICLFLIAYTTYSTFESFENKYYFSTFLFAALTLGNIYLLLITLGGRVMWIKSWF